MEERRYHSLVPSVILAIVMFGLLIGVGIAFWWQERRRMPERAVIYGVEDALGYVMAELSEEARAALRSSDVRRILEWELRYLQDPGVRGGDVAVVGGLEAAQYAQEQAMAQGYPYDGALIIEVLDLQAEYLASLGALGDPVDADEGKDIIDRYDQQG
jgi:hypothetical protein